MEHPALIPVFFVIAALYASAGFGGGSSYLAVMALMGFPGSFMRPIALLCNLAVTGGNTFVFFKTGLLNFKKTWPLLAASVPMAFAGGYLPMKERTFLLLLGGSLVLASMLLFFQNILIFKDLKTETPEKKRLAPVPTALLGGGIGLLSGMVGIGGGVFLSPVLNLLRSDAPKAIAATTSLFIFVNSLAGLAGQLAQKHAVDWSFALPLLAAVLVGGQVGSRLSALRLSQNAVRVATATLTFYAGVNLLWSNF